MMQRLLRFLVPIVAVVLLSAAAPPPEPVEVLPLHPELEPLRPFLGVTWRGDLSDPGSAVKRFDVVRYDRTLNGELIRMLHSVNNGDLGGEMLIRWNEEAGRLEYHYFTSAGFYTTGVIRMRGRSLIAEDINADGKPGMRTIRGLRGEFLVSRTQMFVKGRWTRGSEQIYEPAPDEKIRYR